MKKRIATRNYTHYAFPHGGFGVLKIFKPKAYKQL